MQTFLPYPDFDQSLKCLDYRRLNSQRSEAQVVLKSNLGMYPTGGWKNHVVSRMWKGYENALAHYANLAIDEWLRRGYNIVKPPTRWKLQCDSYELPMPDWFGDERVHSSHRSMLLMKDPEHYSQFGWEEEPGLGYYWPEV